MITKNKKYKIRKSKIKSLTGYTLIELLIVAGILILLSALFLANYDTMQWQTELNAQTQRIVSVLKQAQAMALTGQKFEEIKPIGYGVWFNYESGVDYYVLFADSPIGTPNLFEVNDPIIQTFSLPQNINVTFEPGFPPISLVFPTSGAKIYKNGDLLEETFTLTLTHVKSTNFKKIKINPYGRIEILSQ